MRDEPSKYDSHDLDGLPARAEASRPSTDRASTITFKIHFEACHVGVSAAHLRTTLNGLDRQPASRCDYELPSSCPPRMRPVSAVDRPSRFMSRSSTDRAGARPLLARSQPSWWDSVLTTANTMIDNSASPMFEPKQRAREKLANYVAARVTDSEEAWLLIRDAEARADDVGPHPARPRWTPPGQGRRRRR